MDHPCINDEIWKNVCLKEYFSLGSSPIAKAFQSLYFSKILEIPTANLSKPFALFSLPEKIIIFSFFGNFLIWLILG